MMLEGLTKRLNQLDCATKGWVLHGFPMTRDQAEGLAKAGHHPNRYAMELQCKILSNTLAGLLRLLQS